MPGNVDSSFRFSRGVLPLFRVPAGQEPRRLRVSDGKRVDSDRRSESDSGLESRRDPGGPPAVTVPLGSESRSPGRRGAAQQPGQGSAARLRRRLATAGTLAAGDATPAPARRSAMPCQNRDHLKRIYNRKFTGNLKLSGFNLRLCSRSLSRESFKSKLSSLFCSVCTGQYYPTVPGPGRPQVHCGTVLHSVKHSKS